MAERKFSSPDTSAYHTNVIGNSKLSNSGSIVRNTFSVTAVKSSAFPASIHNHVTNNEVKDTSFVLGRLDGLVSSPNRCSKVRVTDSRKIAAILLETNNVELQRHLLTITVQNQVS